MKKFLIFIPLIIFSCKKNQKENIENKMRNNAKIYLLSQFDNVSDNKITIDSIKLIKYDTVTPKVELLYAVEIYAKKSDSLILDSKEHLAHAQKYSILEDEVNKSTKNIKENGKLIEKLSAKRNSLLDKYKKADSTTFLHYVSYFNIKATDDKSKEGIKIDSVPVFFYKDFSIINNKNYTKELIKKY